MFQYQIQAFNEGLALTDVTVAGPMPGQVLVKMLAASLNYRDLMVWDGTYNPRFSLPLVPCSDGAAEIVECGPGVSGWRAGDKVVLTYIEGWAAGQLTEDVRQKTLGGPLNGVLSQLRLVDAANLVAMPKTFQRPRRPAFPVPV